MPKLQVLLIQFLTASRKKCLNLLADFQVGICAHFVHHNCTITAT